MPVQRIWLPYRRRESRTLRGFIFYACLVVLCVFISGIRDCCGLKGRRGGVTGVLLWVAPLQLCALSFRVLEIVLIPLSNSLGHLAVRLLFYLSSLGRLTNERSVRGPIVVFLLRRLRFSVRLILTTSDLDAAFLIYQVGRVVPARLVGAEARLLRRLTMGQRRLAYFLQDRAHVSYGVLLRFYLGALQIG